MKKWIHCGECLLRNRASGTYYVRVKVGAKQVWKSLETDALSVAKLRRQAAVDRIRAGANLPARTMLTLGACAAAYLEEKASAGLKPRALDYCRETVGMLRRHLEGFDARRVEDFTPQVARLLVERLRGHYSPVRFNGALWALRAVIEVAVRSKVISANPMAELKAARVPTARHELPTDAQFSAFMARLRARPDRADALAFAQIMALTGQRPESIRRLTPQSIDLPTRLVHWPPIKHSERSNPVPMSPELEAVLRGLLARWPGKGPLVPIKSARRALNTASREAGLPERMVPVMFRRFWTTRALEAGIPVPEVAAMRGDKDGGAMLLRTYVHPRLERMRAMVERLPRVEAQKPPGDPVTGPAVQARKRKAHARVHPGVGAVGR